MHYISTRGQAPTLSFADVLLTGLASDGGLYVPATLPQFSHADLQAMQKMSYTELAHTIILPFVQEDIPSQALSSMIDESYGRFAHKAVAPLVQLDHNQWVMELFHGPTLAFKDFAMQLLGRLMDYVLRQRQQRLVIMAATSGDTGSAALEACRHSQQLDVFVLHPHERVSEVQRRQMTTLQGANIHNVAVQGNFDDCQRMVKQSFLNQSFLQTPDALYKRQLGAVNSINWGRIVAQIVYYFYAALSLGAPHRAVSFSVPTGNFGDIYAGYTAMQMGLPIKQLIVATNSNDILHRCISANDYSQHRLIKTLSPSMDIMVSSNFERLLFDLYQRDGDKLATLMEGLNQGEIQSLEDLPWQAARQVFSSHSVDDTTTCEVIKQVAEQHQYLVDPHTAIGLQAAKVCNQHRSLPMVTLATAHPVKFAEAILAAGQQEPSLPLHMQDLLHRQEYYQVLPNDLAAIQTYMRHTLDNTSTA